ncbi:MAG: phage portal protein [Magnetococcales bacterium]|nr:phage portal protein [Magnetococcales bacterium]
MSSGYEAAQASRRLASWTPGGEGVNSLLIGNSDMLRQRSRDIVRRNAWATNGVDSLTSNLVGKGIKPRSILTEAKFNATAHALWERWVDESDAHEIQNFYGLQALAVRAMVEGGEVLIRLRHRRPEDGLVVPLQIQLLEAEHLPTTLNQDLPNGNRIRGGIEFDAINRRVAYHLYPEHPGEYRMFGAGATQPVRVPASEVLHLFRPLRPGQIRGEPWLTQALIKLHVLDQYEDAELERKKTAALLAGFITRAAPDVGVIGEDGMSDDGLAVVDWAPGTIQTLLAGEDIKFSDPADVGPNYDRFLRMQHLAVAAAMGITYEQLTGDLSLVNFSSIRAGLVEMRRKMEQWQQITIIHQMCRPIWTRWMDQAVLSGALRAPGYVGRRHEYQAVKWIPHGWDWVDPLKDIQATVMEIRAGLISREQAISERGFSSEEIDRAVADDNSRADLLGLIYDSDPRHRTKTGNEVVQDQQDQQQDQQQDKNQ